MKFSIQLLTARPDTTLEIVESLGLIRRMPFMIVEINVITIGNDWIRKNSVGELPAFRNETQIIVMWIQPWNKKIEINFEK